MLKAAFGTSSAEDLNKRGVTAEVAVRAMVAELFGGGALGRYGVSPVEMGSGWGRGSQVTIAVTADGPSIIREVMQLKRSGVL